MKNKNIGMAILAVLTVAMFGCEHDLLHAKYENTITDNYNCFWSEFDQLYGAFEAKNINWDSLKLVYGKNLNENSTDQQLYSALCGLLNELNDGHADLYSPQQGYFRSWNRRNKPYFIDISTNDFGRVATLQNVIRSKYMNNQYESGIYSDWMFFWGTIPYKNLKIGYICIPTFNNPDYPREFIQLAIDSFNTQDAVVIDLRFNGGGTTEAFVSSLNSFASEKKLYMKSQYRNGPDHNDFTTIDEHWTTPHNNGLKNIPVAILMNSYSASSSDHFILGMKTQKNVITVGDTTCGAFSAVYERVLPNGWKYRLGSQVIYSPIGDFYTNEAGNYIEGHGIAPDFYTSDTWAKIIKGKDAVLDKALQELNLRTEQTF